MTISVGYPSVTFMVGRPGGSMTVSVGYPLGSTTVEFDDHRVWSPLADHQGFDDGQGLTIRQRWMTVGSDNRWIQ